MRVEDMYESAEGQTVVPAAREVCHRDLKKIKRWNSAQNGVLLYLVLTKLQATAIKTHFQKSLFHKFATCLPQNKIMFL